MILCTHLLDHRAVIATDNVNTYACYIYPDAEATENPNGGIDWTFESTFPPHVGFKADTSGYVYSIPDNDQAGLAGIDGVRE